MTIRSLFDPSKDIYRTIEKVITYGARQEDRLKAEISEYVVTESIEEQFRKLLDRMQLAMESGGENEVGVWVSGFYGSGKSSFTKYLGLAFDDQRTIDGTPFIKHLQDRLHKPQTKALAQHGGAAIPGCGSDVGLGQRDACGRHDGGCLHSPLLQGTPVGRLLA
jgi:hypothetical protein